MVHSVSGHVPLAPCTSTITPHVTGNAEKENTNHNLYGAPSLKPLSTSQSQYSSLNGIALGGSLQRELNKHKRRSPEAIAAHQVLRSPYCSNPAGL